MVLHYMVMPLLVIYNTTIDAEIASIQGTFIGGNHNNVGKSAILNDNGAPYWFNKKAFYW